jgi:hypothetical protein
MALSVNTLARRQITQTANDGWPACSPDGKWLAYQQAKMNIVVVPGVNCFPDQNAAGATRYLERYNYSWRPSWSANGQLLSFVSDRSGQSAIYVIPFNQLAQHPQFDDPALATAISAGGCTDPVWAQRAAPAEAAIVYACDAPTSDDHHGTLVETAGSTHPGWEALLHEGILVRDSLCWIPPSA